MLVVLRDGRKLLGVLRSYDQFGELVGQTTFIWTYITWTCVPPIANLVLEDTVERVHQGAVYAEVRQGVFLIRGENVVLLGEIVCHLVTMSTCSHIWTV